MSGEGFQYTPWGVKPLDQDAPAQSGDGFAGAVVSKPEPVERSPFAGLAGMQERAERDIKKMARLVTTPIQAPRDVVKLARTRIKELRAEVKRLSAVKRELAELERLVRAAKEKPRATVRTIESARRTG